MNIPRPSSIAIAISFLLLASAQKSFACGLDWKVPKNHFDGVNERGNLSYWEKVGDVDLNDGTKVPLVIGFNSARATNSPYLGDGWTLPLLESNVVQVDSKRFLMMLPDGQNVRFRRKDETSPTLQGQGGWMAQLDQNTVTVWAKCGWKIVFTDGKISSITTPKNEQISYIYKNGAVTEVDKDAAPMVSVIDDAKGMVSGLSFNGKHVDFQRGDKPNIENIGGQTVIGHVSSSLAKVTKTDGTSDNFKFAVDPKLVPTLVVSGANNRTFSWDAATRFILKDGDWSYQITPGSKAFSNAQIQRTNTSVPNQTEYYYNDNTNGVTTEQGIDGVRQVIQRFIEPGPLYERVRSVTQIKNGVSTIVRKYDYDEAGKMIREVLNTGPKPQEFTFKYNAQGKQIEIDRDGKLFMQKEFDAQGRLVSKTLSSGIKRTYAYLADGVQQTTFFKNGTTLVTRLPSIVANAMQKEIPEEAVNK